MSNDYYTPPGNLAPAEIARSSHINSRMAGVEAAFDKLPPKDKLLQGRVTYCIDTGVAGAMVVALGTAPTSYVEGLELTVKVAATNASAATINVNGLGAIPVLRYDGTLTEAGDLAAGEVVKIVYVAGSFRLLNSTERLSQSYSTTAADGAATATTQAGIATDAASAASSSASSASGSASAAATSATNAAGSANNAATSATNAANSATAAANSAASILSADFVDKTDAETIGGLKTFTNGIVINGETLDGLTSTGRQIAEAADAAAVRTLLGLGGWTLLSTSNSGVRATVDQTNLADYSEVMLVFSPAAHDSGSGTILLLRTSENNGSSYSVNLAQISQSVAVAGEFRGAVNVKLLGKVSAASPGEASGSSAAAARPQVIEQTTKANAVRVAWSGASFTAGSVIYIYAR